MVMEFRARDYSAEEAKYALPRATADDHPLETRTSTNQVDDAVQEETEFFDPLRGPTGNEEDSGRTGQHVWDIEERRDAPSKENQQLSSHEWAYFKRSLTQRSSVVKTVCVSSISDVIVKGANVSEKASTSCHSDELEDPQKVIEDNIKVISRQDYISRLHELKDEIGRAWLADDRVASLKLSIKVARLLMDTSVSQFYPALFVLVTDVMDMLGDMVWERIRRRAEYTEDGTIICSLQDDFEVSDICSDAKDTCYNWFCKIGSIRELLPRIYLELAILRCWRFLNGQPWECLCRLAMMIRGLADPLASAYCRLYLARCAQKLLPSDIGYLVTCVNDIQHILARTISEKEITPRNSLENKRILISLLEPTIEWILRCIFNNTRQRQAEDILKQLGFSTNISKISGNLTCMSIVLHYLLKELPAELICSHALEFVELIESKQDLSFDQFLNYRLLGFKLWEHTAQVDCIDAVVGKVLQVVTQYNGLDQYLKVVDAYLDIILQYQMEKYLTIILDGISVRACSIVVVENEVNMLQSIFVKILAHFNDLEEAFALNHFVEILDLMYGSSRDVINMHILKKATRSDSIRDPTTIQLLFEISQALHDGIDFASIKGDEHQQPASHISRFIQMVDYGAEMDRHLEFLVECRGAYGRLNELKETLVHSSNNLAIKALYDTSKHISFVKSCIAFSEVTIPSVSATVKQINLYLETAEVSLQGGLLSHTDGLIDSAVRCLQNLGQSDGPQLSHDIDGILSFIRKLCSLLVMVPGNGEQGVAYFPRSILSLIDSKPWIIPKLRIRALCAIISLSATLSQNKFPYHANNREVVTNDLLFYGDPAYYEELTSISGSALKNVISGIQQEPHQATRGIIALEACNCILSFFRPSEEVSSYCTELIEIAKACLNANDKYLQSTVNLIDKYALTCARDVPVTTI